MTTRTDKHRVSEIIPADYRYLFSFSYSGADGLPGWNLHLLAATRTGAETYRVPTFIFDYQTHGTTVEWVECQNTLGKLNYFDKSKHGSEAGGCDVCGTFYLHGDVWQHVPTGECIKIGQTCAEKYGLITDREEWLAYQRSTRQARKDAKTRKAQDVQRSLRFSTLLTWAREHREILPLLKVDHRITKDMRANLVRWGANRGLTENQVQLLEKLQADVAKGPEKHVEVPVDGERIEIEGLVVATKVDKGQYYPYGDTTKMTVKVETADGSWMVYGTAPDVLLSETEGPLKGRRVRFTAKVSKGNRDNYFGFFSRPTKASVLKGD